MINRIWNSKNLIKILLKMDNCNYRPICKSFTRCTNRKSILRRTMTKTSWPLPRQWTGSESCHRFAVDLAWIACWRLELRAGTIVRFDFANKTFVLIDKSREKQGFTRKIFANRRKIVCWIVTHDCLMKSKILEPLPSQKEWIITLISH